MKPVIPILLLVTALSAPLSAQSPVLGKIGGIELTTGEVRESLAGLEAGQEGQLAGDPAALSQYVRALLVQRLVLQQAAADKLDQDPAIVARLVRARETALSEAWLDLKSAPESDWPGETELTAAYEGAKEKLKVPKTWHLAQIYLADKDGSDARLAEVKKKLAEKSADFAAIARARSEESASAAKGGEIGWLTEEQLQPEIRAAVTALKPGATSAPIRLKDGWHILRLVDVREARTPPLDEIRTPFIARLRAEKTQINRRELIARLMKEHPLAINEIELSKLAPAPSGSVPEN